MLSGLLPTSEKTSSSTTSLVSTWTEGLYPLGFDEPQHQILQQPHQYLPVNRWQRRVPERPRGGKRPPLAHGKNLRRGGRKSGSSGSCKPPSPRPDAGVAHPTSCPGSLQGRTRPWHPRRTARWPSGFSPTLLPALVTHQPPAGSNNTT